MTTRYKNGKRYNIVCSHPNWIFLKQYYKRWFLFYCPKCLTFTWKESDFNIDINLFQKIRKETDLKYLKGGKN